MREREQAQKCSHLWFISPVLAMAPGCSQSQEPGTQARSPTWVAESTFLELSHDLIMSTCAGSWREELGVERWCSNVGRECLKGKLDGRLMLAAVVRFILQRRH